MLSRWQLVRGLTSLAESNRDVGSLNLHDWCFRLARQAPSLMKRGSQRVPPPRRCSLTRTGRSQRGRGLYYYRGEWRVEGGRLTGAVIRTGRYLDFCGAWQAVTTAPGGLGTPGGSKASSRQRSIDRGRKALFPETRGAAAESAFLQGAEPTKCQARKEAALSRSSQVLREKIADQRAVAVGEIVADVIAPFE